MSLKDLLVFLDGTEAAKVRVTFAVELAKEHGAHLLGIAFAPTALLPLYGADVGFADMSEVLEEAWELVEHGLIDERDFRQFTFENAARLHTALNPDFFKGTVVEGAVAKLGR